MEKITNPVVLILLVGFNILVSYTIVSAHVVNMREQEYQNNEYLRDIARYCKPSDN